MFRTILLATATTLALGAAVPPASAQNSTLYPSTDPCVPFTGGWIYQGMIEARQRACQQARDAAARQQQADYYAAQAREAAAQQAAARERAAAEARARGVAAAQIAAETSADNACHDQSTAGMLIESYNGLSWSDFADRHVVDIEHLVTITNANGVLACHGVWVHTNGTRREGTLTFKPNVAGKTIVAWHQEHWTPPAPIVAPPETLPTPTVVANAVTPFQQGLTDRQAWESWFAGTVGDYRTGAFYWSGQRSLAHPGSCAALAGEATAGCLAAKARLDLSDIRRKSEPDYRIGWNSVVSG
jgi:hypothetical protein